MFFFTYKPPTELYQYFTVKSVEYNIDFHHKLYGIGYLTEF